MLLQHFFAFVKDMRGKFDIALWPAELFLKYQGRGTPLSRRLLILVTYFITGCILYGWTFEAYWLLILI